MAPLITTSQSCRRTWVFPTVFSQRAFPHANSVLQRSTKLSQYGGVLWGRGNHSVTQTLALSHSAVSLGLSPKQQDVSPKENKSSDTHGMQITSEVEKSAQEHPTHQPTLPSSWPPYQLPAAERQDFYDRDGREEGTGAGLLFPIISTFLPFHRRTRWEQLLKATAYLTVLHWKYTLPESFILNSALIQ